MSSQKPDQAVKFIYNDVTSRFWESGVEDLQSDTQRTGWKLIGIGTRDQSLQLGVFGVSCLLACDILVKYCDRPQPYNGCGFY